MFDLAIAKTATGHQYTIPLLSSAQYIENAKQNGTWITMDDTNFADDYATGLTEEPEEGRYRIMQDFNDRNGALFLDAQESYPNREGVTVYSEAGDVPREVVTFEDVVDFQDWSNSLDRMDSVEALEAVLEAMLKTGDREAERQFAVYRTANPFGHFAIAPEDAYERGSYKAERSAA